MSRNLIGVFLAALAVRVIAAVVLHAGDTALASAHHEHASIARSLAEGRGFRFNFFGDETKPDYTSQQAPLVPGLLAASYLVFGIETPAALNAVLGLQCLASALTAAALCFAAKRMFRRSSARTSATAFAVFYPPMVVSSLHIQSLIWNLLWLSLLLASTLVLLRAWSRAGSATFIGAGIGGVLTDPILAAPVVVLVALLAVAGQGGAFRRRVIPSLALAAAVGLGITPWLIRNYVVHGRFVFIKDSFGYVFWQGNNRASWGTDKLPAAGARSESAAREWNPLQALTSAQAARAESRSVDSTLSVAHLAALRAMPNEISRMDWFQDRILRELRANPTQYLRRSLERLGAWMTFDRTNPRSLLLHYRIGYTALVLLAMVGVLTAGRPRRAWIPAILIACTLTAVHVAIITSARFRVPFEMLLLLPAAAGAATIVTSAAAAIQSARTARRAHLPFPAFAE